MNKEHESQTPEEEKKPPVVKPVLEWAADKGTKRWLLCLAATAAGWLPEQVDDAVDEITEAQYDEVIQKAQIAYDSACRKYGNDDLKVGRGRVRSLVFEDRLLGVLVRRLPPTEAKVLSEQLEKAKEGEAGKLVQDAFKAAVVFPEATLPSGATGEAYERARRMTPNAFTSTLPMKFVNMLGADGGDRAKKR